MFVTEIHPNLEICAKSEIVYNKTLSVLKRLKKTKRLTRFPKAHAKTVTLVNQSHKIAIVFAALCLESLINTYGYIGLKDKVWKDTEKLSTVTKYLVYIKLISGSEFDTSRNEYEVLKQIFRDRDCVVHPKPKELRSAQKMQMYITEINQRGFLDLCGKILKITKYCNQLDGNFPIIQYVA